MDLFENCGFLSSQIIDVKGRICARFGPEYEEILSINRFCQARQYDIKINSDDPDQMIAAVLYARTLSTYQGLIILSERGMLDQVKMLLRCALESLFPLVAISEQSGYANKLIKSEDHEQRKNLDKLIKYMVRVGEPTEMLKEARDLSIEIGEKIKSEDIRKISVFDAAKDAGLNDWYDTLYSNLSNTVHASLRSLQDHLHLVDGGAVEALKNEPEIEGLGQIYTAAAEVMLHAIKALGKIFKIDVDSFIEDTSARIRQHAAKEQTA